MTKSLALHWLALTFVTIGLLPCIATAQTADRFERRDVPVIAPANAFLDETSGKHFAHGGSVVLSRKSSVRAADLQRNGLQARIFRLDPGTSAQPRPWHRIGSCEVYQTSVLPLVRQVDIAESRFVLNTFTDDGWLSPNVDRGVMENGRFLIVFEQSEDMSRVFRLETEHRDGYFKTGFAFVLEPLPGRKYSAADVKSIKNALESRRGDLDAESRINDSGRVCYRMQPINLAQDGQDQTLAVLVPCEPSNELFVAIP